MNYRAIVRSIIMASCLLAGAAQAGPPFLTDDPVPTDLGKWEIFLYNEGDHFAHGYEGESGLDINYGAAPDLQLTAVLPVAYEHGHDWDMGRADLELGAKYAFVHQQEGGLIPNISFYPEITLPTGSHDYTSHKVGVELPVYIQNDFGPWSAFGGGGYTINPGAGNKDYWTVGYAVTRDLSEQVNLGGEISHSTAEEVGGRASTRLGVGGSIAIAEKWSLLAATNVEVQHAHANGSYGFYLGIAFAN